MAATSSTAATALFLALNLLFFSLVTATTSDRCTCNSCGCGTPSPKPRPNPNPNPTPTPTPSSRGRCPRDALKLGVCANLLGLVNVVVGSPPAMPCCSLLQGLADLEAVVCLCTAITANVLGLNLNLPVSLSLLLNYCGRTVPTGFRC